MLTIRDLTGNEEALTDYKELTLNRKVNGEKSISLTILPTVHNAHSFPLVEEESILYFDGEEYVIKKLSERGVGNTTVKRLEAIHKFYVDMINKQQPLIHNGSKTFDAYLSFVFDGTGYTYSIIDTFYAKSFENLGNDNRLALLQKGLERYGAEMELVGTDVRFKKQVGNDTDFQFRYAHNIKTIERSVDTTNLSTVISGTGAEGITAYYRSPNADIFGEIDAPSVNDERFTTEESLLEEIKSRLEDTPEFSITIDFADLRAAGYPWTVPNEGDRVYVIYEPMNDLLIETRILEINEVYDANGNIIKTNVTLANYKKTFAGTMFDNVQKQLRNIVNDDGVVKYSVLDEAVRIATEALQSAQTELEFENGIIARDKNNPNLIVLINSAGVGVSTDGGNTFKTAMTGNGLVADVITSGQLNSNNVTVGNNKVVLNNEGVFVYKNSVQGASLVEGNLTFNDQSTADKIGMFAATVWSDLVTKGISMNMEANRYLSFGHYTGPETGYTPMVVFNPGTAMEGVPRGIVANIPYRANDDIWVGNKAVRFGLNNTHNQHAIWNSSLNDLIIGSYQAIGLSHIDTGGVANTIFSVDENSVDAYKDLDMHGWKILRVAEVQTTSFADMKQDIIVWNERALDRINQAVIHEYRLKADVQKGIDKTKHGLVIGEGYDTPQELVNEGGIDLYAMISWSWKAIQELSTQNEQLIAKIGSLEERLAKLEGSGA